jgi:hypothetical protein
MRSEDEELADCLKQSPVKDMRIFEPCEKEMHEYCIKENEEAVCLCLCHAEHKEKLEVFRDSQKEAQEAEEDDKEESQSDVWFGV